MQSIKEIIKNIIVDSNERHWITLYQAKKPFKFIMNSIKNTDFPKQEEIAETLLNEGIVEHITAAHEKIPFPGREKLSYCPKRVHTPSTGSAHDESVIVKDIYHNYFKKEYSKIGYIVQYELPLTGKTNPYKLGKIDLLSFRDNTLYIYEAKVSSNYKSTIIGAALEIEAYFQHLKYSTNFPKVIIDISNHINDSENQHIVQRLKELTPNDLRKEIIVIITNHQPKTKKKTLLDYIEHIDQMPSVIKLLKTLNISVATLDYETKEYQKRLEH